MLGLRKLACVLFLSSCVGSWALTPLWEEDKHFQWYRCLQIESSLHTLEELAEDMEGEMQEQVKHQIEIIKFNMGLDHEICAIAK
jgi:hypothetical protein